MAVNTMKIKPGDALAVLKTAWDDPDLRKQSFMMHGRPGIGKTQLAEALAAHVGGPLYDVRLTTIDTFDLRGLPYYDHEKRTTVWYRPEDLPKMGPAVLFLDELSAAPPQLQPTVYGLLQERRVGQHKLPDNVMIVAAGNGVEDGAVAFELGAAIADRLIHLSVISDPEDWIANYAAPQGLHPAVIAFIKTRPDLLETSVDAMNQGHMIACTPRSWDRVSKVMRTVEDRRLRSIMVAGIIGDAIMADFMLVADDIAASVRVAEMLKVPRRDRARMYPASLHGLNAMVFGLNVTVGPETIEPALEILLDMRRLDRIRIDEPAFRSLPIKELAVNGFELVFQTAVTMKLENVLMDSPAYAEYEAERIELGLDEPIGGR